MTQCFWYQPFSTPKKTAAFQENLYLRKNMENLRKQKRHLQQQVWRNETADRLAQRVFSIAASIFGIQVESIEARLRNVEAQKLQYQKLFEDFGMIFVSCVHFGNQFFFGETRRIAPIKDGRVFRVDRFLGDFHDDVWIGHPVIHGNGVWNCYLNSQPGFNK